MQDDIAATRSLKVEVWVFLFAMVAINFVFVTGIGEGLIPERHFPRGRLVLLCGSLVAVAFLWRGFRGLWDLVKPLLVWRVSPIWFLAAFLWPIFFAASFVIGKSLVTGEPLMLFNQSGVELLKREGFLYRIFVLALISEIVWVGYSIRLLSKCYSLLIASFITGTFWALWWVPMVIYGIGVIPDLTFTGLWVGQVGIALFCAFFYAITRSGPVILGMQFCFNCVMLAFPVLPGNAGITGYHAFCTIYMVLGLVAVIYVLPRIQGRQARVLAEA